MNSNTLTSLIRRLWNHISKRRRWQSILLLILSIFTSFTEVISIGAILPFLSALTAPDKLFKIQSIQFVVQWLGLVNPGQLLLPLTIAFALAALIAGATRLLLLWLTNRISFAIGADLSMDIYRKTLFQPYDTHVSRNSSEILSGIGMASSVVSGTILPLFNILVSSLIIGSILSLLISINPVISISAFAGFGLTYIVIVYTTKNYLKKNSIIVAWESGNLNKAIMEGLGGIRDILLDGSQNIYCEIYRKSDSKTRIAQAENIFIGASPRYVMESIGMVLIAGFAYIVSYDAAGINSALPLLGALALGAQRLLPSLQQIFFAWTTLKSSQGILINVLKLLDQPLPAYALMPTPEPLRFTKKIEIKNLSFKYQQDVPYVLNKLNLTIQRGVRVGFVGVTGSGKSTLLDIIMALLSPTEGTLNVDGKVINDDTMRAWQANIAHVPQSIYLSDNTIAENIAFGVPFENIDQNKVRLCAQQAQIAEHIEGLKNGYETFVGERGVRLSGGQRQRIGIARALYKNAKVIIFDEATSALDNETEKAVMEAIDGLGKDLTILIIAHRLSTVKNCDLIVELKAGKIVRKGKYEQLFAKEPS